MLLIISMSSACIILEDAGWLDQSVGQTNRQLLERMNATDITSNPYFPPGLLLSVRSSLFHGVLGVGGRY